MTGPDQPSTDQPSTDRPGRSELVASVLRETATGATPVRVAARLGLDVGLVDAVLDHVCRLGLVLAPGCTSCDLSAQVCPGCPLTA